MSWVNPTTMITGQVLNATKWNQDVVANTEFLAKPPSCRVERRATQNLSTGAWRSVNWDTQIWDYDNMWSSTAAYRIDINTPGIYEMTFIGIFSTSACWMQAGILVDSASTTALPNKGVGPVTPNPTAGNIRVCNYRDIARYTSTQYLHIQVLTGTFGTTAAEALITNSSRGCASAIMMKWLSS